MFVSEKTAKAVAASHGIKCIFGIALGDDIEMEFTGCTSDCPSAFNDCRVVRSFIRIAFQLFRMVCELFLIEFISLGHSQRNISPFSGHDTTETIGTNRIFVMGLPHIFCFVLVIDNQMEINDTVFRQCSLLFYNCRERKLPVNVILVFFRDFRLFSRSFRQRSH